MMNKNKIITSFTIGLLFAAGVYANQPRETKTPCLLDSIVYLEEEAVIDLGFDTADYLPEDFDPHKFYFDLNSVVFLENESEMISSAYLPADFNPYAPPVNFMDISYIDPNDLVAPVIEITDILPADIDTDISL